MLIPARHFADDDLVARMVQSKIIPEDFAASVLMTDIQNPVFSRTRCSLINSIPANAVLPKNAANWEQAGNRMVQAFEGTLNASGNAANLGTGAGKYIAAKNMSAAQKASFVTGYANNCKTNMNNPESAAKAMAIRWNGFKGAPQGLSSNFVRGTEFNRAIEDFVLDAAIPEVKSGVRLVGITQSCEAK